METAPPSRIAQELPLQDTLERYKQLEVFIDERISASPGNIALVAIDLERLKEVNDTYGHTEGTLYIRNALEVLRGYIRSSADTDRSSDTVFTGHALHTSGDEFWVILENVGEQSGVDAFVERVQQAFDDLGIGAAFGGRIHQPKMSAAKLIEEADALMYKNKLDRVPELSLAVEARLLGAIATIRALGVPLRSVPIYLEAIRRRRQDRT